MYTFTDLCTHSQIYVHIFRFVCTFTDLCTHLQIYLHIHRSMYQYTFTDLSVHSQIYVRIYRFVYLFTDLCRSLQICLHIYKSQYIRKSGYRFGDWCTNLIPYTRILNTHLQIPVHIHKSPYAFRDSFTHLQIWLRKHGLRYSYTLRFVNSSATIMAPYSNINSNTLLQSPITTQNCSLNSYLSSFFLSFFL